jgi:predicted TIM-barrel fold metal-dependent hydrolase
MIIDMHRHLWSVFERYASVGPISTPGAVVEHDHPHGVAEQDPAARGAQIREEMERAGVDRSVLMLGDYGLRLGEPTLSITEENGLATDLAARDPEHFTAFFGIDPRRPHAEDLFREALDAGARGLKLHPCAGFYPNDPVCRPLYALAGERGVPVAVHTGPLAAPLLSAPAHPIYLDEPAADFPGTTFIILHAGQRAWFPIALDMARWKPNLHLELAMWQRELLESEERFVRRLDEMKQAIGLERVLFGSDCPGLSAVMSLERWVQAFRDLPETAGRYGCEITSDEVDLMLGGNAAALLGLS